MDRPQVKYEPHNPKRFKEMPEWERVIWEPFLAAWRERCKTDPDMKPMNAPPLKPAKPL